MVTVDLTELRALFIADDGLLPDINFNFCGARVVAQAYAKIRDRAAGLLPGAYYRSRTRGTFCPISFGENPAEYLLSGDAAAFHVVFTGMRSATEIEMPDLGVFVLARDLLTLDYRMGPHWSEP